MHPLLYEINTRCWLRDLSDRHQQIITLDNVPDAEFLRWRKLGFTHIWLMGVWTTGPKAQMMAQEEPNLRRAYDDQVPGWTGEDIPGSPYSIADYSVPKKLGGDAGLKKFRERLHKAGMKLVLDFVPNHLGLDHSWLAEHPEFFVQSSVPVEGTFRQETASGIRWIANAKDPYFPPWCDVAQLEYRNPATRAAMKELLLSIADRCDGVRCDMAMLLLNEVFARTWQHLPFNGGMPAEEFWSEAIPAVKEKHPGFLLVAEVYWSLEALLQSLGFDYTYDKQLYDELIWRNAIGVQRHLVQSTQGFVAGCAHFLENHDERRVAGVLSLPEHRAAALVILGLPGMRFLYDGQIAGAKIKAPVQLGRYPVEPVNPEIQQMYDTMLVALTGSAVGRGQGEVLTPREAWPGNPTGQNFVIVQWQVHPPDFEVVVVNLAPHRSQCCVPLKISNLSAHNWFMRDLLGSEVYERFGNDLEWQGLYLDLPAHGAQVFHFAPIF